MIPRNTDRSHAAYEELLGAYALDAVEPEERRALDRHLATCPTCPAELAAVRSAVDAYPLALPDREPPARLRARIEAAIGVEPAYPTWTGAAPSAPPLPAAPAAASPPRRRVPVRFPSPVATPWAVAAVLLLALSLGLLAWNVQLRGEAERPASPDTIALQSADPDVAVDGDLSFLADGGVALLAVRDLPPLARGELYQVWLIPDGGEPEPVGTFDAPVADIAVALDPDRERYVALALTIEPGPVGSPRPTADPIAQVPLSSA